MSKKKKKKRDSKAKSIIPSYREIILILLTFIITYFAPKYFDKADIDIIDLGLRKSPDKDFLEKVYILKNNGGNTAKNVELHLRILKGDKVFFDVKSFILKRNDTTGVLAKNLIYKIDEFVPGDEVEVVIFSNYSNFLKTNNIDTLRYDEIKPYPKKYYGPIMTKLKHSDKSVIPKRKNYLLLNEIFYCKDC